MSADNNSGDSNGNGNITIIPNTIQCHYDILGVPRDADAATIKKHHRKMALKYHPDKNVGDDDQHIVAEKFHKID